MSAATVSPDFQLEAKELQIHLFPGQESLTYPKMLKILKRLSKAEDLGAALKPFDRFQKYDDKTERVMTRVMLQFHHIIEKNGANEEIALFNQTAQHIHRLTRAKTFPLIAESFDESIPIYDLHRIIFQYLPTEDLQKRIKELPTKYLVDLINQGQLNFKEIGCKTPLEAIIFIESIFLKYPLYRVNLGCYRHLIRDHHVEVISQLAPMAREFRTVSKNLTFCSFRHMQNLPMLKNLELRICHFVKDLELSYLKGLVNLQTLFLGNCQGVTNKGMQTLSRLKNLKSLYLTQCTQVKEEGYLFISQLPNLEKLHFSWCSNLSERVISSFANLQQLHTIAFRTCPDLTDGSLNQLEKIPSLQDVKVLNCPLVTKERVDELMQNIIARGDDVDL